MQLTDYPYHIVPAGDSAVLIDFGNTIDESINRRVLAFTTRLQSKLNGIREVVPAYSSISVYFDLPSMRRQTPKELLVFDFLKQNIEQILTEPIPLQVQDNKLVKIPVCYDQEFGPDRDRIAETNNIAVDELIAIHASRQYRVYMLGFLPGFSYLGEVDEKIAMPRKTYPQPVEAGAVGIASRQTGIYPLASPGGWHIIGRTPLKLFDPKENEPTLLKAGDIVEFFPVSKDEFYSLKKEHSTEDEPENN
jgi:inhibitor of KinA